jgi:DNA-binding MarR family transcriptional regulator
MQAVRSERPGSTPAPTASPEDAFMATILELGRRMRQRLPGDELDYSLLPVLRVLYEGGPARHTVLAERLLLDASTVSRKIRQLEERGLVQVSPDAVDGRASQVELLPTGLRALEQLLDRRRDVIADVLVDWPEADRALLHQLLDRFNHDLSHSGDPAPARTDATQEDPAT